MSRPADPEVLLHLPAVPGTDALRAGLMALKCIPTNLPLSALERLAAFKRLSNSERTFLLIDVSNQKVGAADSLDAVCRGLPEMLRSRTLLTRLAGGHVSNDDRAWVKALGFVDMIAEIDVNDVQGDLRVVIDAAARLLALEPLSVTELARYVGGVAAASKSAAVLAVSSAASDPLRREKPTTPHAHRALIRAYTHLSAEKLADLLCDGLAIKDRTYHFKKYPACFVASEAVAWMGSRFELAPSNAVAVGQALEALGLLYHVEQKHVFDNELWFFRLAISRAPSTLGYAQAAKVLRERVVVANRTYLGSEYPQCWVGAQAVDVLVSHRPMPRYQAHRILHRLMSFGLFRHVVDEKPFVDGNFFYRFNGI